MKKQNGTRDIQNNRSNKHTEGLSQEDFREFQPEPTKAFFFFLLFLDKAVQGELK